MKTNETLSSGSRRAFLQLSAAATAAMAFRIVTEPALAAQDRKVFHPGAVVIDANENPLGPCDAARKAIVDMAPQGGRYSYWLKEEFVKTFTDMEGLKPEYVRVFPGSSEPLHFTVLSFTSPSKSYVTADPGYEAGMHAAKISGARIVKTPLTKTYAHDIKAMLAAAPDAGLFYVCTPNNPTGTMTPHSDIEQLLAAKPKGSVVLVDEAYLHFSDGVSALDLVKADRDVIVLRTFSKIYGMAGIRCGMAIGRPDLVAKLETYGGWGAMPITAMAAATASLPGIFLRPLRVQLFHARYQTLRQRSHRRHGLAQCLYRSHLACLANVHAHHRRHPAGNGSLPGRLPSRHEGSSHHQLRYFAFVQSAPLLSGRPVLAQRLIRAR